MDFTNSIHVKAEYKGAQKVCINLKSYNGSVVATFVPAIISQQRTTNYSFCPRIIMLYAQNYFLCD